MPTGVTVEGPMRVAWTDIWGWRGVRLANDRIRLVFAPDIGGRIISLCLDGVEVMFSHPALRGTTIDTLQFEDVRQAKKDLGWLHYGGYKTWLAPQGHWTDGLPFLDLDSGSYEVDVQESPLGAVVCLTSPVCRETGIQFTRSISLGNAGRIHIEQGLVNRSDAPVTWGLWDVTQVQGPGVAVLPVAPSSRFAGGVRAYENEGRSPAIIEQFVEPEDGFAVVRCDQVETFKYGTDSRTGWILGLLERGGDHWLAYLKSFPGMPDAPYPHQADVEVYDSDVLPYFEMEVHSPLQELAPQAAYHVSQTWVVDWMPKIANRHAWIAWIETIKGERKDG